MRGGSSSSSSSSSIEVIKGDLTRPDCPLEKFIDGCEILFHCAGEIRNTDAMRSLHVDGTKRLIDAVLRESFSAGRKIHWVQLSSVGAYGPPVAHASTDRVITEDSICQPANEYEVTKTLADELVVNASNSGRMTYSIIRPSNVYSPASVNQVLSRIIEMVARGMFFYIGRPGAVMTYVHVDDVVRAQMACAVDLRARNRTYNLSNDCTIESLVGHISSVLDVREPWIRIPEWMIRLPLDFLARQLSGRVHIPSINALVLRTRYPSERISQELGFVFSKHMPAAIQIRSTTANELVKKT